MVYLNKIYTRTGDKGETALGDGTRVSKTHPRIGAYGTVDELNAVIGLGIATEGCPEVMAQQLKTIQNDLFDLGADLCVPESDEPLEYEPLRVKEEQVTQLEQWIDTHNERLEPLTSFILPGGTPLAAYLHQGRTVCRRAEIAVLELVKTASVNEQAVTYLNRLSDLLFVMARVANLDSGGDILWKPGGQR